MKYFKSLLSAISVLSNYGSCKGNVLCGELSDDLTLQNGTKSVTPWAGYLTTNPPSNPYFPGTLISPSLFLLSAHYFHDDVLERLEIFKSHSAYMVVVGSHEIGKLTKTGQHRNVTYVSIHPNFSRKRHWKNTHFDFALAHLASPIKISNKVHPLCIPPFYNEQPDGLPKGIKSLYISGWNKVGQGSSFQRPIVLDTLTGNECTNTTCNNSTDWSRLKERFYCTKVVNNNSTAGQGCPNEDIGSFYKQEKKYFLGGPVINLCGNYEQCSNDAKYLVTKLRNDTLKWLRDNVHCGPNKFTCYKDGMCIDLSKLCDGNKDCSDDSDEREQYCTNPVHCREHQFQCNRYRICINKTKVSDGINDCPDGDDESSPFKIYSFSIIGAAIALVVIGGLFVAVAFLYFKVRRTKDRRLSKDDIDEFYSGYRSYLYHNLPQNSEQNHYNVPIYVNNSVLAQPWDTRYEIPAHNLELGEELGRGEFGVVYEATVNSREFHPLLQGIHEVAVKTNLSNMGVEEFKNLLREIKIMAHVGSHPCVLSFIGAFTQNIRKLKVFLIVEYCPNGNMLNFLQSLSPIESLQAFDNANLKFSFRNMRTGAEIIYKDLLKWAKQIASGMTHLENKNVIHGDLAARNILLTEHLDAKICDFGLARELTDSNIYLKTSHQPIPWKWLAVESLNLRQFTYKSDVWAYGVTIWEIFSLGQPPYGDVPCDSEFLTRLMNGNRLPYPKFASKEIYEILLSTWDQDPLKRPSFQQLEVFFQLLEQNI